MKTLDEQVDDLVDHMTDQFVGLSEDPYFREAIMKAAIRRICHQAHQKLEVSAYDIADHLDVMAEVMRDEANIGEAQHEETAEAEA